MEQSMRSALVFNTCGTLFDVQSVNSKSSQSTTEPSRARPQKDS